MSCIQVRHASPALSVHTVELEMDRFVCPVTMATQQLGQAPLLRVTVLLVSVKWIAIHVSLWWQILLPSLSYIVQCPAGKYKDTTSGNCIVCPVGTYQSAVGQTFCMTCPKYKTTATPGSTQSSMCSVSAEVCVREEHDCSEDAVCTVDGDSYECDCLPGFTGDGKNCTGSFAFLHYTYYNNCSHYLTFIPISINQSLTSLHSYLPVTDVCNAYCQNGGTCSKDSNGNPSCSCNSDFYGNQCEASTCE